MKMAKIHRYEAERSGHSRETPYLIRMFCFEMVCLTPAGFNIVVAQRMNTS